MEPGGDACSREPWRMAASVLHELGMPQEISKKFGNIPQNSLVSQILSQENHVARTSSCGRLFDAAASLLGVANFSKFEAEAPMLLESLVRNPKILEGGWLITEIAGAYQLSFLPLMERLMKCRPDEGAELFHGTLAKGLSDLVYNIAKSTEINIVALSGGCICNKVLAEELLKNLSSLGLSVYLPRLIPPNDGGISLGQAWIALNLVNKRG